MTERDLQISERFKALLRPHTTEEHERLTAAILAAGRVREPLVYWWDGEHHLIVDGMNRYEIAREHNIDFGTIPLVIDGNCEPDILDVEIWILQNQAARRNLTQEEMRHLAGELYDRLKQKQGGDRRSDRSNSQSGNLKDTVEIRENVAEVAGKSVGVSARTAIRGSAENARKRNLESMTDAARKACESLTDSQVKAVAKLSAEKQNAAAREARTTNQSIADVLNLKPRKKRGTEAAAVEEESTGTEPDSETASRTAGDAREESAGWNRKERCPACGVTGGWSIGPTGAVVCTCGQLYGEPAGDHEPPEDGEWSDAAKKAKKKLHDTLKAAIRALDDLHAERKNEASNASLFGLFSRAIETVAKW